MCQSLQEAVVSPAYRTAAVAERRLGLTIRFAPTVPLLHLQCSEESIGKYGTPKRTALVSFSNSVQFISLQEICSLRSVPLEGRNTVGC
jgi:hypothetical protein